MPRQTFRSTFTRVLCAIAWAIIAVVAIGLLVTPAVTEAPALIIVGVAGVVLSPVSWTHHQIWLVLAVLLPMGVPARLLTLAVMILPVTAPGGPVLENARLLLAVGLIAGQAMASSRTSTDTDPDAAVRRDDPTTPIAATTAATAASNSPVRPYRNPSP